MHNNYHLNFYVKSAASNGPWAAQSNSSLIFSHSEFFFIKQFSRRFVYFQLHPF